MVMKRSGEPRVAGAWDGGAYQALVGSAWLLLACLLAAGCGHETASGPTMGTRYRVLADCPDGLPREAVAAALDRIAGEMSTWEADSTLSRFNRAPPGDWFAVSRDLAVVAAAALDISDATDGAFDVTVGAAVGELGFGPDAQSAWPGASTVDYRLLDVRLDPPGLRRRGPVGVDLSAIAKGFAVDQISGRLDAAGCASSLVEIGGEVRVRGRAPGGGPWRVAVASPGDGYAPGVVRLAEGAVATSGDYLQAAEPDGERLTHIVDPQSGASIGSAVASATVIAPTAMEADAMATALMVMGEAGISFAEARGMAALLVLRRGGKFENRASAAMAPYLSDR